jgi:hypothetical protein
METIKIPLQVFVCDFMSRLIELPAVAVYCNLGQAAKRPKLYGCARGLIAQAAS